MTDIGAAEYVEEETTNTVDKSALQGTTEYLKPTGTATRAQLAAILQRFSENNTL